MATTRSQKAAERISVGGKRPEFSLSENTLSCIAQSLANLKAGKRFKPIDLKQLLAVKT